MCILFLPSAEWFSANIAPPLVIEFPISGCLTGNRFLYQWGPSTGNRISYQWAPHWQSVQKVQGHRTAQGHRAGVDVDVTPPTGGRVGHPPNPATLCDRSVQGSKS